MHLKFLIHVVWVLRFIPVNPERVLCLFILEPRLVSLVSLLMTQAKPRGTTARKRVKSTLEHPHNPDRCCHVRH